MAQPKRGAGAASLAVVVALVCVGCGGLISPLQSPPTAPAPTPLPSPSTAPTPFAPSTVTGTPTATPTVTLTPTPGPSPTPNTEATSAAVFATITALAATPTYPPTSTPRPQRTPIGEGPGQNDIPPTALYSAGGIAVLSLSQQVIPGGAAALTVKTRPSATCTLRVVRGAGDSARLEAVPGAPTRVAGRDGVVAWVWTVDAREPAGMMTLSVDCGAAGKIDVRIKVTQ